MIYLDSSALVKQILVEPESRSLSVWLVGRISQRICSSALARVEVIRTVRARDVTAVSRAREIVDQVRLVGITKNVLESATNLRPHGLRALDAIHLASALRLGDELEVFVAYDKHLLAAAEQAGLRAESPGAS